LQEGKSSSLFKTQAAIAFIQPIIDNFITNTLPRLQQFATDIITVVAPPLAAFGSAVGNYFKLLVNGMQIFADGAGAIWGIIVTLWQGAGALLGKAADDILNIMRNISEFIKTHVADPIRRDIQNIVLAWNIMSAAASSVWATISGVVGPIVESIITVAGRAWEAIKNLWDFISTSFINGISVVWGFMNTLWGLLVNAWNTIKDSVITIATLLWDTITTLVGTMVDNIINSIASIADTISNANFIKVLVDAARNLGSSIINGVKDAIGDALDDLASTFIGTLQKMFNRVKEWLDSRSPSRRAAKELGVPIGEGVAAGIEGTLGTISGALTTTLGDSFGRVSSSRQFTSNTTVNNNFSLHTQVGGGDLGVVQRGFDIMRVMA